MLHTSIARPISEMQKELLMECHESQILKMEPALGPKQMKYLKRLVKMGLIVPKNYEKEGKILLRFYITPLGVEYLDQV